VSDLIKISELLDEIKSECDLRNDAYSHFQDVICPSTRNFGFIEHNELSGSMKIIKLLMGEDSHDLLQKYIYDVSGEFNCFQDYLDSGKVYE